MLLMNVLVEAVRGVSIMYAITVGNVEAMESSKIAPDALHTKTSIWPGVSTRICLIGFTFGFSGSGVVRFSRMVRIWSIFVAKRLREVRTETRVSQGHVQAKKETDWLRLVQDCMIA